MTVRQYPVTVSAGEIEDVLYTLTDGTVRVVAVEVFDHPESHEAPPWHSAAGTTIGPWVVGTEDEVYAWLADRGHEDYDEQYAAP